MTATYGHAGCVARAQAPTQIRLATKTADRLQSCTLSVGTFQLEFTYMTSAITNPSSARTYNVVPALFQAALVVSPCCGPKALKSGPAHAAKVVPCPRYDDPPTANKTKAQLAADAAMLMQRPTSCVIVRLVPGLRQGETVAISLSAGSKYHPDAGPLQEGKEKFYVHGLRRFRIPVRSDFTQPANFSEAERAQYESIGKLFWYRRGALWLPHGLAAGTKLQDLARNMELCRYKDPYSWQSRCEPERFTLERPKKSMLLLQMLGLMPKQHYALHIRGSSKVCQQARTPRASRRGARAHGVLSGCLQFSSNGCWHASTPPR